MDKEHVKGAADKAKGAMKDAACKMTGDKKLESEGKIESERRGPQDARRCQGRRPKSIGMSIRYAICDRDNYEHPAF